MTHSRAVPARCFPVFLVSHPLLTAPIGRSLLRLAGPTTGLMVVQIFVAIAETWLIGSLGTDALAAFALVLPFMVLMLNMAHGGMGGGVAAAMARALGAGRHEDARALVLHALILALAIGALFTALAWIAGPMVFAALGGSGRTLQFALGFSNLWFGGAVLTWLNVFLSAILRGAGDAATPARCGLLGSFGYVAGSIVLVLGIGDWSGIGMAGAALASVVVSGTVAVLMAHALWRSRLGFVPALGGISLQARLFREILRVGLAGAATSLIGNFSAMVVTGLVGTFGVAALAGYGIGVRLEFMLGPLAWAIGSGLITLVGVAVGAAAWRRAAKVAWTGSLVAFAIIGALGWAAVTLPETWSRLFAADPAVIATSVAYITRVAPFYGLLALGLTLNFAAQGAGRMTLPLVASIVRMTIATAGGWLAVEMLGLGLNGVFLAIALGTAAYGLTIAGALFVAPWGARHGAAGSRSGR